VLLFALLLAGSVYTLSVRGLTVYLDGEEIAQIVRERVMLQARQDLPALIAGAKEEIPHIVEEEMADQLSSDRMEIAGLVFRIPDELLDQLRGSMKKNVENATGQILDGIDTDVVAEKFGDDVYRMVLETISGELADQSFQVTVFGKIPIRIRVALRP
jgi:hypothetical protein